MIRIDAFGTGETTLAARITSSTGQISADLTAWVRLQNRMGRNLTEPGALKLEAFGTASKPKFMLKGGETNVFLEYLVQLLPAKLIHLGEEGPLMLEAGRHLFSILEIIRKNSKSCPAAEIQKFHIAAKGYLVSAESLRVVPKPKDHMLLEMSLGIAFWGSPKLYGNWQDESLNRLLRDVAGGAHSSVHDKRILVEFPRAHDNQRAGLTTSKRRRSE